MSNNSNSAGGGVGLGGLLFLVFLTLKLTDVIDWSWWWVTAPIWAPISVVGFIAIIAVSVKLFIKR